MSAIPTELPRYDWFDQLGEDSGLRTRTQLSREGLKPGAGPAAYIYWKRRDALYLLYRLDEAVPKRRCTEAQLAVLRAAREKAERNARTCPICNQVRPYRIYRGTCHECEQQEFDDFLASARNEAALWASNLLQRSDVLFVDFESTSLDGYAVELGILDLGGNVILDTLINPLARIEEGAEAIHGISQAKVASAPTFATLVDRLAFLLHDKIVVAYNSDFDSGLMHREIVRHFGENLRALEWCRKIRWDDAMEPYSAYVGDWSEYHGDFRWQRLGGGHRALGDCRVLLETLQRMAASLRPAALEQSTLG